MLSVAGITKIRFAKRMTSCNSSFLAGDKFDNQVSPTLVKSKTALSIYLVCPAASIQSLFRKLPSMLCEQQVCGMQFFGNHAYMYAVVSSEFNC